MASPLFSDTERLRRIHRVLVMLYQEHKSQADIATEMNLSPATINRMIREGHDRGLVDIRIRAPFGPEAGMAQSLKRLGRLDGAVVVHSPSTDPAIVLQAVAEAAATALLDALSDGMTIAVSGGVGLCAVIEALNPVRRYDVRVVPATGGVQGKFRTDVNHVAMALAEKLGGTAYQLHAPVFAATEAERAALLSVSMVRSVLDMARAADLALFGIGSVDEDDSTYRTLTDSIDSADLVRAGASGELLAHLVTDQGVLCDHASNRRLVALTLEDLARIPTRIAIASGAAKVAPIAAVLRGGMAGTLITDDRTALAVIEKMGGAKNANA